METFITSLNIDDLVDDFNNANCTSIYFYNIDMLHDSFLSSMLQKSALKKLCLEIYLLLRYNRELVSIRREARASKILCFSLHRRQISSPQ